jgi:curved DNA-binding protein
VKNYYSTLGVDRTSTPDQIKQAYRKLASQHHPDKGGDTARFQEIQEAYAVLSDAAKRQQYDNPMPQFSQSNTPFDFDAIFNIFGADLRGQRRPSPRLSIWIALADVVTGGPRTMSIQTDAGINQIEIDIPQGIRDNDNIRYPELGPGGQDLIVNFRIRPDAKWQHDGTNIITEVIVDIWDLVLGSELTITDILNKELIVRIPPETQPQAILRARGRGLPARKLNGDRTGTAPGDLLIKLNAKIKSPIDPSIIDAIRKSRGQ